MGPFTSCCYTVSKDGPYLPLIHKRYLQVKEQEVDFVTMGTEDAYGVELLSLRSPPLTFGHAPSLRYWLLSGLDRKVETQKIEFGEYHILSHGKLTM